MQRHVLYTPDQADQMVPLIRAIVEDQREVYLRLRHNLAAFKSVEELDDISGDHRLPKTVRDDLAELRGYLLEIDELGVRIDDPEAGLVSMRGLHNGEIVNLCWRLGEPRVTHWYPAGGEHADRRPLEAVPVRA
jgi:hypothetical protein